MVVSVMLVWSTLFLGAPVHDVRRGSAEAAEVFVLSLDTPNRQGVKIAIPSGQRATVGREDGPTLTLTAIRADADSLELVALDTRVDSLSGQETSQEIARLRLGPAAPVRLDYAPFPIGITWLETRTLPPSALASSPAGPCTGCCVVCEGEVTCACRVQTECGDCCCPNACGCDVDQAAVARGQTCGDPLSTRRRTGTVAERRR